MNTAALACENCGRPIGKLETPAMHDNHIVCAQCRSTLAASARVASQPPPLPGNVVEYRALGLNSRKTAWILAIVGVVLSPAIIGIPLLIWGATAEWMLAKHQRAMRR